MRSQFQYFAAERYAVIRANFHLPSNRFGRRAVMLKAAEEFWGLDPSLRSRGNHGLRCDLACPLFQNETVMTFTLAFLTDYLPQAPGPSESPGISLITEPDPLDFDDVGSGNGTSAGSGKDSNDSAAGSFTTHRGIIVRTDFSQDASWTSFLNSVLTSEREGMRDLLVESRDQQQETNSTSALDSEGEEDDSEEEEEEESDTIHVDEEQGTSASSAFVIIDPSSPSSSPQIAALARLLLNCSNLTLLRLFADIDIIPCLPVPPGEQRRKVNYSKGASARLVDSHGLHEIYNGPLIWVYDTKSNTDGCARLVSGRPSSYGTAT
ncbi:hypothetical protein BS47DRAFT_1390322 [Hydnum rufescens UP504]|uniref:Uncharacterized protein n=1 Tax=Hydnum rufescens UP504 TaxID=1448309 RepID=A0A9P6DX27_9AGAM|nr:hypothetical protein BS47DRAFT_1390322 [Hydnum rufescens UP504]